MKESNWRPLTTFRFFLSFIFPRNLNFLMSSKIRDEKHPTNLKAKSIFHDKAMKDHRKQEQQRTK